MDFLDPRNRLVDEVVGWLCGNERFVGRCRTVDGAHSLAHEMVVVPTAQSGRNLRLALAKEAARRGWGGILPPQVVLPKSLVKPADETLREATEAEIAAAFQQYVHENQTQILQLDRLVRREDFEELTARFALLDQLQDIWRILAGGGLVMRDVATRADELFADEIGDERERWAQLAELEEGFFAYLHDNGLRYPTEAIRLAKSHAAVVSDEIEADATVWRERSYEIFDGKRWETGQFDRVVFVGEGETRKATIYDFKTNAKPARMTDDDFAALMREHYAPQMSAYRLALSRLTGILTDRIAAKLLLAATGQSVAV